MQSTWVLPPFLAIMGLVCCDLTSRDVDITFPEDCSDEDRGLNSFLWTIKRSPPAYLFGTIHVPYDRVWEFIPNNSKLAFSDSDSAIFELDLTNPYTLAALSECQMLPKGEFLLDILPGDLYNRLQRHLDYVRYSMADWMSDEQRKKGLYADYLFNAIAGNWRRKRPVWIMLMVNSLTEEDVKSRGIPVLDLYLAQQAEREGKVTGAVERVEEQCVPLNDLDLDQVIFALNQTLWQHESLRAQNAQPEFSSTALIKHYNCGDLNSLMFSRDTTQVPALINASLPKAQQEKAEQIERYFQEELLDKRNRRMAQRVAYLIEEHPNTSFFFAFGAGHFLGNETVIDRLRHLGLEITHTQPGENITRPSSVKRRKPRKKSRKFVLSDDFPQPSDVIYGDIQYLFSKRNRHNKKHRKERRKQQRAKKRQERQGSLWSNIDPNSLYNNRQNKNKNQIKRTRGRVNKFNDLWVRTEQISPRYLEQFGESAQVHTEITSQRPRQKVYWRSYNAAKSRDSCNVFTSFLLIHLCAILVRYFSLVPSYRT